MPIPERLQPILAELKRGLLGTGAIPHEPPHQNVLALTAMCA